MAELKSSIDHLPQRARGDLARLVEILQEEFAAAVANRKAPRLRDGKILKIVLFGSYARGTQVVDPVGRYFSDYDLLVVVDHEELTDTFEYWAKAEERMLRELAEGEWPQPFNLIVHTLDDVNYKLRLGRYFFVDMLKDGIALYEAPGFPFDQPVQLSSKDAESESAAYFAEWFTAATRALKTSKLQRQEALITEDPDWRRDAAFSLHQATERAYYCLLLVMKLYMPKSHNLNFLSGQCEQIDSRLIGIWQKDSKFGQRCYELLRAAYIKARYSKHYKITDEELDWLSARIDELHALTRVICEERLAKG